MICLLYSPNLFGEVALKLIFGILVGSLIVWYLFHYDFYFPTITTATNFFVFKVEKYRQCSQLGLLKRLFFRKMVSIWSLMLESLLFDKVSPKRSWFFLIWRELAFLSLFFGERFDIFGFSFWKSGLF